jgi:ATP-dependent DNA ligase
MDSSLSIDSENSDNVELNTNINDKNNTIETKSERIINNTNDEFKKDSDGLIQYTDIPIDYDCIDIFDFIHPKQNRSYFSLPVLYRKDAINNPTNDKIRVWKIEFFNNELITQQGISNGAIQEYRRKIETNSSGRTIHEQAFLEMKQRYKSKLQEGYIDDFAKLDKKLSDIFYECQLAMTLDPEKPKVIKSYPAYVSWKLDGIRNLVLSLDNKSIICKSKENNIVEVPRLNHIRSILAEFIQYLPRFKHVDGELYCHGYSLQTLKSWYSGTKTVHENHRKLNYYIFDMYMENRPAEFRYMQLVSAYLEFYGLMDSVLDLLEKSGVKLTELPKKGYLESEEKNRLLYSVISKVLVEFYESCNPPIQIVPQFPIYSFDEIKKYHDSFVGMDYEGIMIRKGSYDYKEKKELTGKILAESYYRERRNINLYKFKYFLTDEAFITDVEMGKGTYEGAAILCLSNKKFANGKIFKACPKGFTIEERKELYKNKKGLIGKQATIKFQCLSDDGIPIFPVCIAIRDYE